MTILHEYESTFILRPDITDEELTRLRSRFEGIVTERGGQLMVFEDWGRRRLAYPILRLDYGRYLYLNYVGTADAPAEIERICGIEDNVVRFLTVRLAETVTFESSFSGAIERQRKRLNRSGKSDDDRRSSVSSEERRRSRSNHDSITSPSPIRYENADGTAADMSHVEQLDGDMSTVDSDLSEATHDTGSSE